MKILITGNMGYVGPVVIRQLRKAYPKALLIGYDTGYFAHCLAGEEVLLPEHQMDAQYFGDVRNFSFKLLKNVDAVVCLSAISNDPMGNTYEEVTAEINHKANVSIALAARDAGVHHFIFASSCSVYGQAEGPRNELSELNPLTAYAKSKINTESDLEKLASDEFLVTCLRFATACGMSDRLRLDLVLNDFVAGAVAAGKIEILSDGTPWRPLIHVADMARAIEWAIERTQSQGDKFLAVNAGSNEWNYQVRDLAYAVAEIVPGVDVSINTNAQPDKRSYQVDFSLYRELAPQHQPEVSLMIAVQELSEGLEKINFKDKDFRKSKYIRLITLNKLKNSGLINDQLQWL